MIFYGRIIDIRDDPVVADTVLPECAQLGAFQGFADGTRIIERRHTLMEKAENAPRRLVAKLFQFTFG